MGKKITVDGNNLMMEIAQKPYLDDGNSTKNLPLMRDEA